MSQLENKSIDEKDYLAKFKQNKQIIFKLSQENESIKKLAFDMLVRKVIDTGLVYNMCNHNEVDENPEFGTSVQKASAKVQRFVSRNDRWDSYTMFRGLCKNCKTGLNLHECALEGEQYWFTCDEARVINNVARQYGAEGSIHTATQVRD